MDFARKQKNKGSNIELSSRKKHSVNEENGCGEERSMGVVPQRRIGEHMLECTPTKEGAGSRRGVQYEVANGVGIPDARGCCKKPHGTRL